jgi:murein DD-endopeptidase MepM/ murein hydrolase activator NlpD
MADSLGDANAAADFHPNCDTMKRSGLLLLAIALTSLMLFACGEGKSGRMPQPTVTDGVQLAPSATTTLSAGKDVSNPMLGDPAKTPLPVAFPTIEPSEELDWRPPPYPAPWALRPEDHYYFWRPIPSGQVNWPHPFYRYGSSYFGESDIHTGVDLGADRGAPVLAAGPGEVVWAGYGLYRGIEDTTDPYGLAVAIRHDFGYQGQALYTIYGHMQEVFVWDGQHLEAGEQLGTVGSTGHSDGPHLHFEVRLGENRYFSTRNPELWMVPPEGWAVLAGRITDTYGNLLPEFPLKIRSLETGKKWEVWTYVLTTIHPDEYYNENFVISDLPAGPYEITIDFVGFQYVAYLTLYAGETNFILFRGRNGFVVHPTPTPVDLSSPPDL